MLNAPSGDRCAGDDSFSAPQFRHQPLLHRSTFLAFSIIAAERKKCLMLAKLTIVADAPSDLAWPELLEQNRSFHWEMQKIARFTCSAKQRRRNCIGEN
jgi:hypothetical protein